MVFLCFAFELVLTLGVYYITILYIIYYTYTIILFLLYLILYYTLLQFFFSSISLFIFYLPIFLLLFPPLPSSPLIIISHLSSHSSHLIQSIRVGTSLRLFILSSNNPSQTIYLSIHSIRVGPSLCLFMFDPIQEESDPACFIGVDG